MALPSTPIGRRIMLIVLATSGLALLLTCVGFVTAQLIGLRQSTARHLETLGGVIAANSTAALAFEDADAAKEILGALSAEPNVVGAELLDAAGQRFAVYPANAQQIAPATLAATEAGYHHSGRFLIGAQPVLQEGTRRLGTLIVKFDMAPVYRQLIALGGLAALVAIASLAIAYLLSRTLQRQISQPLAALVATASSVSDRGDYSVRAPRMSNDELGRLTDAFNLMLEQIERQHDALEESEARVRAVVDAALSAVVVVDGSGVIVDWNRRAEAMFGRTRAEAIGLDIAETIVPPRYRQAHRAGLARFHSTGHGPNLNRLLELTALRADGSEFPVELSVSPIRTGTAATFCGFLTDITERKESQLRVEAQLGHMNLLNRITRAVGDRQDLSSMFRVVLQNLEDDLPTDFACVLLNEMNGESLMVSSFGARSAVLAARSDMLEQTQIPVDRNGLSRCLRGELVYEPNITTVPFAFPQRLTQAGLGSMVIAPLQAESRVFGVLVAARRNVDAFSSGDCEFLRQLSEHVALASHQAHLHSALQIAYDELQQTQKTVMQQERLRALGQMASGVAHDINNAISPITLYAESLLEREPNLSERARGYLTTIRRSIDDVAQTVSRMREFYRPREPQLVLARVNLNRLAGQVVELTRARWRDLVQERGVVIDLTTAFAPSLPEIMGAENEIRDAITNLIFNAVDAMPDGGTLSIRTRAIANEQAGESPANARVVLEISDSGIGMDEETRRRCLEPFYTTKGERGSGLGLAMVYGMVQRHSAELEIDSATGRGTTVRLIFAVPVIDDAAVVRHAVRPATPRRLHILIVDDDPFIITAMRDILESDGHLVAAADGGRKGIALFAGAHAGREPFDAVITDLGMPYVDGRQVAAEIKSISAQTPVVLLTGWGQRLHADKEIPPHVDRVLNKPPKIHELRTALAELIE